MENIVLVGAGGHAKSVIDTIEKEEKYHIIGFLDPNDHAFYKDYKVIGKDTDARSIFNQGVKNAFITIGFMGHSTLRMKLFNSMKSIGFSFPNIIDRTAVIANDVCMGEGNFVGKRAVINANSQIGIMNIINTGAVIEHDCIIEKNVHMAVGAVACGNVTIHADCFIGANATIIQGVQVDKACIIGAGAVVINDVNCNSTMVGIPAANITVK